jgi:uncharacterized protein (TIGR02646 family)
VILIKKSREPNELLAYRKKSDASYSGMPWEIKASIKKSLVREQGHLCAYCMSRLPDNGLDDPGNTDVTIEHWNPQKPAGGKVAHDALDYRNMLAVCNGNRGGHGGNMTCDASKGNKRLTVNPLKEDTLYGIYYTSNGEIHSSNAEVDKDLVDTLNLNCTAVSLPQRRLEALRRMWAIIHKRCADKEATRGMLQSMLREYEDASEYKTPYVGILTNWLKRKLRAQ